MNKWFVIIIIIAIAIGAYAYMYPQQFQDKKNSLFNSMKDTYHNIQNPEGQVNSTSELETPNAPSSSGNTLNPDNMVKLGKPMKIQEFNCQTNIDCENYLSTCDGCVCGTDGNCYEVAR